MITDIVRIKFLQLMPYLILILEFYNPKLLFFFLLLSKIIMNLKRLDVISALSRRQVSKHP